MSAPQATVTTIERAKAVSVARTCQDLGMDHRTDHHGRQDDPDLGPPGIEAHGSPNADPQHDQRDVPNESWKIPEQLGFVLDQVIADQDRQHRQHQEHHAHPQDPFAQGDLCLEGLVLGLQQFELQLIDHLPGHDQGLSDVVEIEFDRGSITRFLPAFLRLHTVVNECLGRTAAQPRFELGLDRAERGKDIPAGRVETASRLQHTGELQFFETDLFLVPVWVTHEGAGTAHPLAREMLGLDQSGFFDTLQESLEVTDDLGEAVFGRRLEAIERRQFLGRVSRDRVDRRPDLGQAQQLPEVDRQIGEALRRRHLLEIFLEIVGNSGMRLGVDAEDQRGLVGGSVAGRLGQFAVHPRKLHHRENPIGRPFAQTVGKRMTPGLDPEQDDEDGQQGHRQTGQSRAVLKDLTPVGRDLLRQSQGPWPGVTCASGKVC